MNRRNCGSPDHELHRRLFLQGSLAAGAVSVGSFSGLFSVPSFAEEAKRQQKRCILLWLCGAAQPIRDVGSKDRSSDEWAFWQHTH